MSQATILFSGREWLLPAAGAVGVALLLLWWTYRASPQGGGVRLLCALLKLLGLLALAACLLEPLWSQQRAKPGANYLVLLADNSQSMQIKGRSEVRSLGEQMRALLSAEKSPWQSRLLENFQLRRYFFDARLQSAKDFSELTFDGRASALVTSLQTVADRFRGQPLAGILLFTDGNATDLGDTLPDLTGLPPIYPALGGRDEPLRDIGVQKVTVSQTAFEDAPVTVQADIAATGYPGEKVVAQLIEAGNFGAPTAGTNAPLSASNRLAAAAGQTGALAKASGPVVAEQTLKVPDGPEPLTFRFQVRPTKPGVTFYRVGVAVKGELDHLKGAQGSEEATLANNVRIVAVDRGGGPYRLLYVSGRPNWEFKFLNRAVAEDDQVQMVALIRVAKREPKFEFRGRAGESSNPLYRGFDQQSKEDTEGYDKPVLVRLNTRDQFELAGGFPKAPEELYEYTAVIIDDLEAEFFTPDQMTLVQKFVSERGGGLLMLGGAESFAQGKYLRTALGNLLPVYLEEVRQDAPPGDLKLLLTREGWLQPWARLRNNEPEENARLSAMPAFQVMNEVRGLKPGASPIAVVSDNAGKQYPAIAVQRFGHGHVAAAMIGDFWRWGLRDESLHRDMDKAWRQLVRWLVVDVPHRVELAAEPRRGDANHAVTLQVRVRDKKFLPLDNAAVTLNVRFAGQPAGAPSNAPAIRITAEPALNEAGLYTATFVPRETGGYFAEAVAADSNGAEVGRAQTGWSSDPAAEEFQSLKPNRALLETLARQTGGQMVDPARLEDFARALPNRKVPVAEAWTTPLWHQAFVFLFALACFVAEWGLRRWKGMV